MIKFRPPSRTEPPSETARPPTLRSDAEQRRYVRRAGAIRVLEAWRAEKLKDAAEQLQAGTEPSHCLVEIAETTRELAKLYRSQARLLVRAQRSTNPVARVRRALDELDKSYAASMTPGGGKPGPEFLTGGKKAPPAVSQEVSRALSVQLEPAHFLSPATPKHIIVGGQDDWGGRAGEKSLKRFHVNG